MVVLNNWGPARAVRVVFGAGMPAAREITGNREIAVVDGEVRLQLEGGASAVVIRAS